MSDKCPCGAGPTYPQCCGRFHSGEAHAETAEQLMRSRYSAFAKAEIEYLRDTYWPPFQKKFDPLGNEARAKNSVWLGLQIKQASDGGAGDTKGMVHFVATSMMGGQIDIQEERSQFKKKAGRWYYVSGE